VSLRWSASISRLRWRGIGFGYWCLYIIYTPNLGLKIAILVREREQGRFRGSIEGAGGAAREQEGAVREQEGALKEQRGLSREPVLTPCMSAMIPYLCRLLFNDDRSTMSILSSSSSTSSPSSGRLNLLLP